MKLTYFTKKGKIIGWAYGDGASYEVKGQEKHVIEIKDEQESGIMNRKLEPYFNNGNLEFINRLNKNGNI